MANGRTPVRDGLCAITARDPHREGASNAPAVKRKVSRRFWGIRDNQQDHAHCHAAGDVSHRTPATDAVQSGHQEAFMDTIHKQDQDLAAVLHFCALGLALSLTLLSMLPADVMLGHHAPGSAGWTLTEDIR